MAGEGYCVSWGGTGPCACGLLKESSPGWHSRWPRVAEPAGGWALVTRLLSQSTSVSCLPLQLRAKLCQSQSVQSLLAERGRATSLPSHSTPQFLHAFLAPPGGFGEGEKPAADSGHRGRRAGVGAAGVRGEASCKVRQRGPPSRALCFLLQVYLPG